MSYLPVVAPFKVIQYLRLTIAFKLVLSQFSNFVAALQSGHTLFSGFLFESVLAKIQALKQGHFFLFVRLTSSASSEQNGNKLLSMKDPDHTAYDSVHQIYPHY